MKHFFKLYSIPLLFLVGMNSQLKSESMTARPALATPSVSTATPSTFGQTPGPATNQVSVHEMFKDVPQDELIAMMEEGQQFIKYLEEHGTPEEKMAFAQAMEETLQGFSEDDWKEFEQIVETVQDKLPPLVIEPKEIPAEIIKEEAPKKEEIKIAPIDNSLEKLFHAIHKSINAILLKAKSDKVLTERITIGWDKKDDFNEMVRLLQSLNKKEHIAKLTSSKDDAIKSLLESIQNFNKRLQVENDQLVIADTFGLEVDEQTTAINLKKLNKILEFFDSAIESLLPKLIKFMQEYEPEALKKTKDAEESAKKALENSTKVEKMQKRPAGNMMHSDKNSSNQKRNNNRPAQYNPGTYGNTPGAKNHPLGYLEETHLDNVKNLPQLKKSSDKGGSGGSANKSTEDKKDIKKSSLEKSIDTLLDYLESYNNVEVGNFMTTISKAGNVYKSFGNPIDENSKTRAAQLIEKRSSSTMLQSDELSFLNKYEEQLKTADQNFGKNIQQAHTFYAELRDSIDNISPQIDEMQKVLSAIKVSLDEMSSKDLEKLSASVELKNFGQRINTYHTTFKNVQHELKNKHQLHRLKRQDPYEERDYNELALKVSNLHGLDKKISDAKSQLEILQKAIKSTIARRKRDENKAASTRN